MQSYGQGKKGVGFISCGFCAQISLPSSMRMRLGLGGETHAGTTEDLSSLLHDSLSKANPGLGDMYNSMFSYQEGSTIYV